MRNASRHEVVWETPHPFLPPCRAEEHEGKVVIALVPPTRRGQLLYLPLIARSTIIAYTGTTYDKKN